MYGSLALIVIITVISSSASLIRLGDMKFNVNGAPAITNKNNETVTTPGSVKEDENNTDTTTLKVNKINNTVVTDSPIVLSDVPKIIPAKTIPKEKYQEMLARNSRRQNVEAGHRPQIKVTVIKSEANPASVAKKAVLPPKDISENLIESRRTPGFNVYVPISEDIFPRYDEDAAGKGIDRSGLSLIDLNGNLMRIRL